LTADFVPIVIRKNKNLFKGDKKNYEKIRKKKNK
jgi:hypothetical protein